LADAGDGHGICRDRHWCFWPANFQADKKLNSMDEALSHLSKLVIANAKTIFDAFLPHRSVVR
jgi:hypothetical protein